MNDDLLRFLLDKFPNTYSVILSGSYLETKNSKHSDIDILLIQSDIASLKGEVINHVNGSMDIIILPKHQVYRFLFDDYHKRIGFFIDFIQKGKILYDEKDFATDIKEHCTQIFAQGPQRLTKTELVQAHNRIFTRLDDFEKKLDEDNGLFLSQDVIDSLIDFLSYFYNTWSGTHRMKHRFLKKYNLDLINLIEKESIKLINNKSNFPEYKEVIVNELKKLGMPGSKLSFEHSFVNDSELKSFYLVFQSNYNLSLQNYIEIMLNEVLSINSCEKTIIPNITRVIEFDIAVFIDELSNVSVYEIQQKILTIYNRAKNNHLFTIFFVDVLPTIYSIYGQEINNIALSYFKSIQSSMLENLSRTNILNELTKIIIGINLTLTHALSKGLNLTQIYGYCNLLYEEWIGKSIDFPFLSGISQLVTQKKVLIIHLEATTNQLDSIFEKEYKEILENWDKFDEDNLSTELKKIWIKIDSAKPDSRFAKPINIFSGLLWDSMDLIQLDEKKRVSIPYVITQWIKRL